ncbi:MAG: PIN domain-containing protein [Thermoproteus sp.]
MKILPDTTYLLPILGVKVPEVMPALRALRGRDDLELYYSPFSLLEALGKIAKEKHDPKRLGAGLMSIAARFNEATPSPSGYLKAAELRQKGHGDLIDLLLYATARDRGLRLLTRDLDLLDFLRKVGEDLDAVITEEELLR